MSELDPAVAPWGATHGLPVAEALNPLLTSFLETRRWFRGKSRPLSAVRLFDTLPLSDRAALLIAEVAYLQGPGEFYALPVVALAQPPRPDWILTPLASGYLADIAAAPEALEAVLAATAPRRLLRGSRSALAFERLTDTPLRFAGAARATSGEQTNTSLLYGQSFVLKIVRRLDEGESPAMEMGRFLTLAGFDHSPALAGALTWKADGQGPCTLGLLHVQVANAGDGWGVVAAALAKYFGAVDLDRPLAAGSQIDGDIQADRRDAALLGRRTADLHQVLAGPAAAAIAAFAPEPLTAADQKELAAGAQRQFEAVSRHLATHPAWPALSARIAERIEAFAKLPVGGQRLRVHGDLHLGQILVAGTDFAFIDFEGEPNRSLAARRGKRCPLVDVAGMLRSYHYAAMSGLQQATRQAPALATAAALRPWAEHWYRAVSAAFLQGYLGQVGGREFLPRAFDQALAFFLLEKGLYELGYELDNRPDWVEIPLAGLAQLLPADRSAP